MTDRGIIIFVKNPIIGKVKTRLAKEIGEEKALAVYRKLLEYTKKQVDKTAIQQYIFYSDFIDKNDLWSNPVYRKYVQVGKGLGDKMKRAIDKVLMLHKKVVIIGSDCPLIQSNHIVQAFIELESSDFVIGPAVDGGYYLLGLKKNEESIFKNIEWSTEKVYAQTTEQLTKLGLSYSVLERLPDIDYKKDLDKYGKFIEQSF